MPTVTHSCQIAGARTANGQLGMRFFFLSPSFSFMRKKQIVLMLAHPHTHTQLSSPASSSFTLTDAPYHGNYSNLMTPSSSDRKRDRRRERRRWVRQESREWDKWSISPALGEKRRRRRESKALVLVGIMGLLFSSPIKIPVRRRYFIQSSRSAYSFVFRKSSTHCDLSIIRSLNR